MLTLSNVGNGIGSASYYEGADDYYFSGRSPSVWWGIGAAFLGLEGTVDSGEFAAILDGRLPTGASLHHTATGRRGGTDATFSAPKSVSLQALIGDDHRIIDAHSRAVNRALAYAETLIACRITEDGVTRSERTGNLVVAQFSHDLSRSCDPQLHTHCVLINATRRADGQWRAADNQAIYRHKMFLGVLYRSELARELQTLGYKVRLTHLDGRFELAHINERQVKAFSQRSAAIDAHLKTQGMERGDANAWDRQLAALITRDKKTDVDRLALRRAWDELSAVQGINYSQPAPFAHQFTTVDTVTLLSQSIAHVSERHSVFSELSVLQTALERGVGSATLSEIQAELCVAVQSGCLIRDGLRYTTQEAQQLEREIQDMEVRGRTTLYPIYQGQRSNLIAQLTSLSTGQRDAVLGVVLSANRIVGIQGRAGAGKTTLLKIAADQARACGYTVKGLAPSASAARELAKAGIDSETIAAFIHRQSKKLSPDTLLIVDEAGMVSTRQMHTILTEATTAGCRVVLVGDTAQLHSVEAGKPFAQLQNNGMHTSAVNQIQRQKNLRLKHAVELAVDGQTAMAISVLDKHIVEIVNSAKRFERIAIDYVSLPATERATTRVIAGTRYARAEINRCIRTKLGLDELGIAVGMLDRKDHTLQQARSILSYDPGDLILAETDYPSLGLKRNELATVIERQAHCILLERADGARTSWQPALATKLTAYVPVKRSLAVDDLIRVTANDRERGLINGDMAWVDSILIERKVLTLRFADGRLVQLSYRRPLALDHGYCSTVHASQGQTCDRVLIEADTSSLTSNENTFYVAISRARHHVQIYTDDRDMLPLAMCRQNENASALELGPSLFETVCELDQG